MTKAYRTIDASAFAKRAFARVDAKGAAAPAAKPAAQLATPSHPDMQPPTSKTASKGCEGDCGCKPCESRVGIAKPLRAAPAALPRKMTTWSRATPSCSGLASAHHNPGASPVRNAQPVAGFIGRDGPRAPRGGSEPGPRDEPRGLAPRGNAPRVSSRFAPIRYGSGSESTGFPSPYLGLTTLPQDRLLASFEAPVRGSGFGLPEHIRLQGAWIAPLNRVVVGYLGYRVGVSRLWIASIDTAPRRGSFGDPVGRPALALEGTYGLHGLSGTSVRNDDRSVDAVFAVWDSPDDGSVRVFGVSGHEGTPGVVTTVARGGVVRSGVTRSIDALGPAVSVGRVGTESKILLAFGVTHRGPGPIIQTFIEVGFLTRDASMGWRFSSTGLIPTPEGRRCEPQYNVAAAWDGEHEEWGLAWWCGADDQPVVLVRIAFDGRPSTASFNATFPGDPAHSPMVLSYNRRTDRYLVQLQHDVFWARRSGDQLRCLDNTGEVFATEGCGGPGVGNAARLAGPWGSPVDRWPKVDIATGGIWASGVDYTPGREFREGGGYNQVPCVDDEGCGLDETCSRYPSTDHATSCLSRDGSPATPGVSVSNRAGTYEWTRESPRLWSGARNYDTTGLHQYIRVPQEALVVAIFVATDLGGRYSYGELRYTFLRAPSEYDFDE